jgi:acetoin utilization protein AcuB
MRTIREVMTARPLEIDIRECLADAAETMARGKMRHLLVMERGHLVGVLSDRDLHRFEAGKRVAPEVVSVGEAMTPDPYAVPPEAPLAEVARVMAERGYGCAVVMAGATPIGIFTTRDALRLLAALAARAEAGGAAG